MDFSFPNLQFLSFAVSSGMVVSHLRSCTQWQHTTVSAMAERLCLAFFHAHCQKAPVYRDCPSSWSLVVTSPYEKIWYPLTLPSLAVLVSPSARLGYNLSWGETLTTSKWWKCLLFIYAYETIKGGKKREWINWPLYENWQKLRKKCTMAAREKLHVEIITWQL